MSAVDTCEVGAPLVQLNIGSWNFVWQQTDFKE